MLKIFQQSEEIKDSVLNDLKVNLENPTLITPSKKSYALSSIESQPGELSELLTKTDSNEGSAQLSDVQENQTTENKKKTRPKKRNTKEHISQGDPIKKIIEVNNRSYKFQKHMNDLLIKILYRYELDKPILMQDKLDIIWDKS